MSEVREISKSHLVLIPTYNSGEIVLRTVEAALAVWSPVWVVVDGSNDGTAEQLEKKAVENPNLRVLRLARNHGKGAAVLHGAKEASASGFTHILAFDADGQHPADFIERYMEFSMKNPDRLILGKPIFPENAPWERVWGRKLCNFWANVETLGGGIGDTLFGMRVYPVEPLLKIMESIRWARRYDFDTEMAVRLVWDGARTVNVNTPVKYLTPAEGGVSHFRYLRDNSLLTWMHLRLVVNFFWRWPRILLRRRRENFIEALSDTESEESRHRRVEIIVRHYVRPWYREKARRRLNNDPIFEAIARELQNSENEILEIGTGTGLLPFFLRRRGIQNPITALAKRRLNVSNGNYIAQQHYDAGVKFKNSTTLEPTLSEFSGTVILMDGLQQLTHQEQEKRLRLAAKAVAPGGKLILRELDIDEDSWADRWAHVGDRPGTLFSSIEEVKAGKADFHFPDDEFVEEIATSEGLLKQETGSDSCLLVFSRP